MPETQQKRGPKPLPLGMKKTKQLRTSVTRMSEKVFIAACKIAGIRPPDKLRELAETWAAGVVSGAEKPEEANNEQRDCLC